MVTTQSLLSTDLYNSYTICLMLREIISIEPSHITTVYIHVAVLIENIHFHKIRDILTI